MTALQALAAYSVATKNRETSLKVKLYDLIDKESEEFEIKDEDKNREYIRELVSSFNS